MTASCAKCSDESPEMVFSPSGDSFHPRAPGDDWANPESGQLWEKTRETQYASSGELSVGKSSEVEGSKFWAWTDHLRQWIVFPSPLGETGYAEETGQLGWAVICS